MPSRRQQWPRWPSNRRPNKRHVLWGRPFCNGIACSSVNRFAFISRRLPSACLISSKTSGRWRCVPPSVRGQSVRTRWRSLHTTFLSIRGARRRMNRFVSGSTPGEVCLNETIRTCEIGGVASRAGGDASGGITSDPALGIVSRPVEGCPSNLDVSPGTGYCSVGR